MTFLRRFALLTAAIGTLTVCPARADVLVADDFESYSLGNLNTQNGGTAGVATWTAAYAANALINVVSGGLSYANGSVVVNGGSQSVSIGGITGVTDNVLNRSFDAQGGPIYFRILYSPVAGLDANTVASPTSGGDFVQFLINDNTDLNRAGSLIMNRIVDANPFSARVRDGTTDTNNNSSVNAVQGETYMLVGKFWKSSASGGDATGTNYDRLDLWINPTSNDEGLNSIAATAIRNSGSSAVSYFTIRTADLNAGDDMRFDSLVLGTTFADVVPVPEPGTLAMLLGLSGIACGAYAWKRRRGYNRVNRIAAERGSAPVGQR